mmetsp:Transcript_27607/g.75153  ORF Transcript_27607/g.75153 Transcript_27607/m.75153 type:complete len:258 (+) Transcript_27607:283-1056(+)
MWRESEPPPRGGAGAGRVSQEPSSYLAGSLGVAEGGQEVDRPRECLWRTQQRHGRLTYPGPIQIERRDASYRPTNRRRYRWKIYTLGIPTDVSYGPTHTCAQRFLECAWPPRFLRSLWISTAGGASGIVPVPASARGKVHRRLLAISQQNLRPASAPGWAGSLISLEAVAIAAWAARAMLAASAPSVWLWLPRLPLLPPPASLPAPLPSLPPHLPWPSTLLAPPWLLRCETPAAMPLSEVGAGASPRLSSRARDSSL